MKSLDSVFKKSFFIKNENQPEQNIQSMPLDIEQKTNKHRIQISNN